MKLVQLLLLIMFLVILGFLSYELATDSLPVNEVNQLESHYLKASRKDHGTYNVVTVVLGDFRAFDTLLETIVIFIASLSVLFTRNFLTDSHRQSFREFVEEFDFMYSSVSRNSFVLVFPLIILFGLYVFIHGHYSPGGGFQAGVILASAFIVYSYVYANKYNFGFFMDRYAIIINFVGVAIYFTVGMLGFLFKNVFLDYEGLVFLGSNLATLHSVGILIIELGVTLTVMSSTYLLFRGLYCENGEGIDE